MSSQIVYRVIKGSTLSDLEMDNNLRYLNTKIDAIISAFVPLPAVIPTLRGGTGIAQTLSNNRIIISSSGAMIEHTPITANRAIVADSNGLPIASSTTLVQIGYLSTTTGNIQSQINSKYNIPGGSTSQYLRGDGSIATFPTGLPPGGTAGGDLSGTYPNPAIGVNKVTFAKFQQIANGSLLGRYTTGAGNIQEITLGSNLVLDTMGVLNTTGGGTVTSVSGLTPLFTTTDPTTTPTFVLSNAGANTYFGNASGSTGAPSYISAGALSKVDDANITITLGGTPNVSLLAATSLTLGWTGQLGGDRGGTGVDNTGKTITLGGNLVTSGAFGLTLTLTNTTNVTLPTTGTLATQGGAESLTNKTSYNGLVITANTGVITTGTWNGTAIANANLANSTITINGTPVSLGGSISVTAIAPNALTIGTGLTGTSYNGSAPVTIAIDATVSTLSGTQTITNKTSYNGLVVTANTGVVTTGTWSATPIDITKGGTGGTVGAWLLAGTSTISAASTIATNTFDITFTQSSTRNTRIAAAGNFQIWNGATSGQTVFEYMPLGYNSLPAVRISPSGLTFTQDGYVHIKGQGTGTNNVLMIQDSAGVNLFRLQENNVASLLNGYMGIGTAGGTGTNLYVVRGSTTSSNIVTFGNTTSETYFNISSAGQATFSRNSAATSVATDDATVFTGTFNPTSGGRIYNFLHFTATVNQTGGANGVTRGIFIEPTLTAAFDFRAIETARGNVMIGTTSGNLMIGNSTGTNAVHLERSSASALGYFVKNTNNATASSAFYQASNANASQIVQLIAQGQGSASNGSVGTTTNTSFDIITNSISRITASSTGTISSWAVSSSELFHTVQNTSASGYTSSYIFNSSTNGLTMISYGASYIQVGTLDIASSVFIGTEMPNGTNWFVGNHEFAIYQGTAGTPLKHLSLDALGSLTIAAGTIKTAQPSGSGAGAILFGKRLTALSTVPILEVWELNIDGLTRYVQFVTPSF